MSNIIRLASPLEKDSITNGEGIRTVIWTQGCSHQCKGCHNPNTHSFKEGFVVDVEQIKEELNQLSGQDGITLSGGDPLFQIEAIVEIAKYAQEIGLNVWVYSGFTYEQIVEMSILNPKYKELFRYIDVLVDGKFVLEKKTLNLPFRGSSNQRMIHIPSTILEGEVVLVEEYQEQTIRFQSKEFIFV